MTAPVGIDAALRELRRQLEKAGVSAVEIRVDVPSAGVEISFFDGALGKYVYLDADIADGSESSADAALRARFPDWGR